MSRYRLQLQKMFAENRDEAIADIMTELIRAGILSEAHGTSSIRIDMAEAARFDWRTECKKSIAHQIGELFYRDDVIAFRETVVDNRIEIEGTVYVMLLGHE